MLFILILHVTFTPSELTTQKWTPLAPRSVTAQGIRPLLNIDRLRFSASAATQYHKLQHQNNTSATLKKQGPCVPYLNRHIIHYLLCLPPSGPLTLSLYPPKASPHRHSPLFLKDSKHSLLVSQLGNPPHWHNTTQNNTTAIVSEHCIPCRPIQSQPFGLLCCFFAKNTLSRPDLNSPHLAYSPTALPGVF